MNAVRCPQCGIHVPTLPCWSCEKMPTVTAFGYPNPRIYDQIAAHIAEHTGTVDVHSAGAQIGTETWTLAMHLAARNVKHAHITATDANPNRLSIFRTGRYLRSEVELGVRRGRLPAEWVSRYFTPDGPDHLTVTGELRALVTITGPAHMPEDLPDRADVLMLRNVWLHLEDSEREALVDGILTAVPRDGLVFFRAGTGIPLAPIAHPFLFAPDRATPSEPVQRFRDFNSDPHVLVGYRRAGREAEQVAAWRARLPQKLARMIRRYGYRDTPGKFPASRPNAPMVLYRGATPDTWNGVFWSPRREIAESYAAITARAGWDARVFVTTVPPEAVIHQVDAHELWVHPDAIADAEVDSYPLPEYRHTRPRRAR